MLLDLAGSDARVAKQWHARSLGQAKEVQVVLNGAAVSRSYVVTRQKISRFFICIITRGQNGY